MKDYKGRGSNLSFGEQKKSRRGWVWVLLAVVAVAGVYLVLQGWRQTAEPQETKTAHPSSGSGNAIPLQLPPPPAQSAAPEDQTEN